MYPNVIAALIYNSQDMQSNWMISGSQAIQVKAVFYIHNELSQLLNKMHLDSSNKVDETAAYYTVK